MRLTPQCCCRIKWNKNSKHLARPERWHHSINHEWWWLCSNHVKSFPSLGNIPRKDSFSIAWNASNYISSPVSLLVCGFTFYDSSVSFPIFTSFGFLSLPELLIRWNQLRFATSSSSYLRTFQNSLQKGHFSSQVLRMYIKQGRTFWRSRVQSQVKNV